MNILFKARTNNNFKQKLIIKKPSQTLINPVMVHNHTTQMECDNKDKMILRLIV